MPDFVWIIPAEQRPSLGNGGISPKYIIPQGQMHGHEQSLRGKRVWIVLRGIEDRCMAVAAVKKVERFSEGYYANDFLISCDTAVSFRLSSSFEGTKPYSLPDFRNQETGVHQMTGDSADRLKELVSRTIQVKLTAPPEVALRQIKFDAMPKKGEGLAKAALSQITKALPLDQVWAAGPGTKLGPFCNFAVRLLAFNKSDSSVATNFLRKSDPALALSRTDEDIETTAKETSVSTVEKSIDLDFTEIDPDTIYAREFVLSDGKLPDLESALNKTEAAEKLHQDMLRDITSFLRRRGLSPYESASVDLMISLNGRTKIFEIKSSTPANAVAQAAKGAFQIACYINAMAIEYEPLDAALIMHEIRDAALEGFVHDALDRLGIKYLVYYPEKEWPDRVHGLLTN